MGSFWLLGQARIQIKRREARMWSRNPAGAPELCLEISILPGLRGSKALETQERPCRRSGKAKEHRLHGLRSWEPLDPGRLLLYFRLYK